MRPVLLQDMRHFGLLTLLAAAAVAGYLMWTSGGDSTPVTPSSREAAMDGAAARDPEPLLEQFEEPSAIDELTHATGSMRVPPALATLRGRVIDGEGTPIEGAGVTWSALTSLHFESLYVWDVVQHDGSGARLQSATDSDGRFAFSSVPIGALSGHTALWITCPGYRASGGLVELDRPIANDPLEFVLESGPRIRVRVVDAGGRPVPGARVDQCGIRTPPERLSSPAWTAAHRAFLRSATTDADGRLGLELSEFPATYTLIARVGAQRSQPWFSSIDGPADDVVLRMGPQFQAHGIVRWPTSIPRPDRGLVTVSGVTSAYQLVLSQARVAEDGTWGPLEVPLFGAISYVFQLQADGCGAEQRTVPAPQSGALLRVDFAPQQGFDLPLQVVDDEGAPVGGASLLLTTGVDGDALMLQGHTDAAGRANLRGVRPGYAHLDVTAPEHPPARVESIPIGPAAPELLRVALGSSAGLAGRVTHAGEPVEDFEIAWWTDALFSGQAATVERFQSVDGQFSMQGLPRERVSLLAVSNEHPRSEARTLDLSSGVAPLVEIELPAPIAASGRIVDAFTGDAISGAVVQQYTNAGPNFVHAWGTPSVARADGSFDLPGLAPGDNRLTVQASGYADRLVSVIAPDTTHVDLGPVPIFRGMELVLVHAARDPRGTDGLRASLVAARQHPPQPFEADGSARFQGVTPGRVVVDLVRRNGSTEVLILDLPPAVRHVVEVGDGGDARVEFLVPEDALATLVDPWIGLRDRMPHGLRTRSAYLSPEGRVEFLCLVGSAVSATLWSSGRPLATHAIHVTEANQHVVFDVTPLETTLEVVDVTGRPIPFAEVHLYDQDGWTQSGSTGADGRATFAGLPTSVLAGATSPTHGMRFDVPVEPGPPSRPTRIDLRADATLHLVLTTANGPAAGIQVRAMGAADTYLVGYATTDDEGRAAFTNIAEGEYTIHVEHPGLFRRTVSATTGPRARPTQIRVHGLGGLQLRVRTEDNAPLAAAELDLRHSELPGSLRSWLAEGRVRLERSTRTDGEGLILLPELPAGPLDWTAVAPERDPVQGTVVVQAGEWSVID